MTFWIAVDVFIGLVLVYLLLAMIGTSLQEALASWLNLRGKYLEEALASLLTHSDQVDLPQRTSLSRAVASHPIVNPALSKRFPSYVAAGNFGAALIDKLLIPGSTDPLFAQVEQTVATLPDGNVRTWLTTFLVRAGGDLDKLQASIETWFDDAMDGVSGMYKRMTHWYLLAFGFVAAVAFNVDTIAIASALMKDPSLQANVLATSQAVVSAGLPTPPAANAQETPPIASLTGTSAASATATASANASAGSPSATGASDAAAASDAQAAGRAARDNAHATANQLASLKLPIGWPAFAGNDAPPLPSSPAAWLAKALGLLITALAVSLGSPFWFNLLENVLRVAGPKPDKSGA